MYILKEPVKLSDNEVEFGYAVDCDEFNVILYKLSLAKSGKKKGEVTSSAVGFYSTLRDVLSKIYTLEVGLYGLDDLKALTEHIHKLQDELVMTLGNLNEREHLAKILKDKESI